MNTKAFITGFTTMDSCMRLVSATKRSIVGAIKSPVHGTKVSVQAAKTGVRNASEVVTSFFAGAKQAIEYRRGTCRALTYDARSNEEQGNDY